MALLINGAMNRDGEFPKGGELTDQAPSQHRGRVPAATGTRTNSRTSKMWVRVRQACPGLYVARQIRIFHED